MLKLTINIRISNLIVKFLFYREVFKAKHRQTGKKVALKKVLMENEKEGVSVWVLTLLVLSVPQKILLEAGMTFVKFLITS